MENGALQVSIIDFGLAKKYRDPKTHIHIPYRCLPLQLLLLFALAQMLTDRRVMHTVRSRTARVRTRCSC
jgi:hypothetical protein